MPSVPDYNREAWNRQSAAGSRWTTPVDAAAVARARRGELELFLTPNRPAPADWLGELPGRDVLALGSGGGQQAPLLAAAGARVVSVDLSDRQLAADRLVAEREGLDLRLVQGDMADLSALTDASFDLIFHPVSNVFVPDPEPVWRECRRVLRPGGELLAGFMNPFFYLFDHDAIMGGAPPTACFRLPYADLERQGPDGPLPPRPDNGDPWEYSHSLQTQIGGQLAAGLVLVDLYEDWWEDDVTSLNRLMPTTIATRARRPAR